MLRYLETFFRNKWIISIPGLILMLSGAGLIRYVPREYHAGARVWTERSVYLAAPGSDNQWVTPASIQSGRFHELISSDTFSRAVVDRTLLDATATETEKQWLADNIKGSLHVYAMGEHSVIVNFTTQDPQLAVDVVNIAIEEYNRVTAESGNAQALAAIRFYQDKVKEYEEVVLPRSGGAVKEYLENHPELRRAAQEGGMNDPAFSLLQQQASLDRAQYERYQQRLDEVMVQASAARYQQEVAFRVMDPPTLEAGGGMPSKKQMLMFSGAGLALCIGYALLFVFVGTEIDRTFRYPGDVRRWLNVPVLDVIPDYAPKSQKKQARWRTRRRRLRQEAVSGA